MPDNWPERDLTKALAETEGEEQTDEHELADLDLEYRARGRPRLPDHLRRREKLVISLTAEELRGIMMAAAGSQPSPLSPNDWARRELLRLARR